MSPAPIQQSKCLTLNMNAVAPPRSISPPSQDARGKPVAAMDPPGDEAALFSLLQTNFLNNYNGNRAPLGLWVHAPWFTSVGDGWGGGCGRRA